MIPVSNQLNRLEAWAQSGHHETDIAVIAEQEIHCGVTSLPTLKPIPLKKIFKQFHPKCFIKAYISELGVLGTRENIEWIHLVRLAENCFEANLLIHPTSDKNALIVQSIRKISVGEELKVWLGPDLLSTLNIPFLGPANIVSHQNYKCHRCSANFTQPNPLKVHIALNCSFARVSPTLLTFENHQLSSIATSSIIELPTSLRSASNGSSNSSGLTNVPGIAKETEESLSNSSTSNLTSTLLTKEPRTHVCVFCGKLYTRKYGLKIHLRTHTGHKPLQCRFCGRPFSDPSNLNKHIRLHSQHHSGSVSSPYKCKKCSKILVRRRDLERHLKSRHK